MTPGTTGTPAPPGLVRLRRCSAPSPAALDLLDAAARFDAEMGFGPRRPGRRSGPGPAVVVEIDTCLHRHDVEHDDAYVLAGVLTVRDRGDGTGTVELVVDPRRRAIGVATATLEELGTRPAPGGWAGSGLHTLHAVAHGSHPAAERLARRSGVTVTDVRHHLTLPAGERPPRSAVAPDRIDDRDGPSGRAPGTGPAVVRLRFAEGTALVRRPAADEPAEISAVTVAPGTPESGRGAALAALIASATGWLREQGAAGVEARAGDGDEALLEALRRQLFEHDRSDLVFRIA